MTDGDRIAVARALVAEIAHALDCAEVAIHRGHAELLDVALIAGMLAADGVIRALGWDARDWPDLVKAALAAGKDYQP